MFKVKEFEQAEEAHRLISEIDSDYDLDNQGIVCLFEVGYRPNSDTRLEFEKFLTNLSHITRNEQFNRPSHSKLAKDIK